MQLELVVSKPGVDHLPYHFLVWDRIVNDDHHIIIYGHYYLVFLRVIIFIYCFGFLVSSTSYQLPRWW
jgi:hypothetical protein